MATGSFSPERLAVLKALDEAGAINKGTEEKPYYPCPTFKEIVEAVHAVRQRLGMPVLRNPLSVRAQLRNLFHEDKFIEHRRGKQGMWTLTEAGRAYLKGGSHASD